MPAGDLTTAQRAEVQRLLEHAERQSGLTFSAYLGAWEGGREGAEVLLERLADPDRSVLVAVDPANRNAMLSARNVDGASVRRIEQLNAFDLLNHRYLVVDKAALQAFIDGSCFPTTEAAAS